MRHARLLACCALTILTLGAAVATPGGAAAQPAGLSDARPSSLSLRVVGLDAVVDPDGELRVHVDVGNAGLFDRADLRVVATVHRATIGRFQYQQAVDAGEVGSVVHAFVADLDAVPARGSRAVALRQTADELGLSRPGQEGVYPLRLQLLADGEPVDEVTTSLVVVPDDVTEPLEVALLLPLALPPARDAEGVVTDPALLDALDDKGLLTGSLDALASTPDLAATLVLDGHTLTDLTDLTDGFALREDGIVAVRAAESPQAQRARMALARLTEVTRRPRVETLALPYADADLVALVRFGLGSEVVRHLDEGAAAVAQLTGTPPTRDVLRPPTGGLDPAALAAVRSAGVDAVVLDAEALRMSFDDRTPSPVRRLTGQGAPLTALVPDALLAGPLTRRSPDGPVVGGQRVLGEIASVYFERPQAAGRGLLVAPPDGTTVPAELVAELAGPLAQAPFARTSTLTQLTRRVDTSPQPVGLVYPDTARRQELPAAYLGLIAGAREALGSLSGVLGGEQTLPSRFDRLLLQASSASYRGEDLPRGRALTRTVTDTVTELYGAVDVLDSPPVTLTALEGELPVTIRSNADVPLLVRIELVSGRYEVEGGPTREIELPPASTQILTFRVRDLAPGGTAPVGVVLSDRDGVLDLARGTVVVRSTAFSVAGLVVTLGAAAFLLLWILRALAQRRRERSSTARRATPTSPVLEPASAQAAADPGRAPHLP